MSFGFLYLINKFICVNNITNSFKYIFNISKLFILFLRIIINIYQILFFLYVIIIFNIIIYIIIVNLVYILIVIHHNLKRKITKYFTHYKIILTNYSSVIKYS